MHSALLICSDGDCAVLFLAHGSLEELDSLACDCGWGLQVLGPPEALDELAGPLELMAVE